MKQFTDSEFLIWLSQRMKFKYSDHIEISQRLEKISIDIENKSKNIEKMSQKDYNEIELLFR